MGKPTGFMDYKREDAAAFSVEERIKNFNEFHTPLSKEEQQKQGARLLSGQPENALPIFIPA